MYNTILNQWTITKPFEDELIQPWMESFITDRKIQNLSPGTIYFYTKKLKLFLEFCNQKNIIYIHHISPNEIREFLDHLEKTGHNPGGIHACYRTLRTFLYWLEEELEPENWKNPIRKVKAPRVGIEPLEPVAIDVVEKLLNICKGNDLLTLRDRSLLLFLLDSGARASEVCALDLSDVDPVAGSAMIRNGKGRKPRIVFLGQKTRKAIRAYLKYRNENDALKNQKALWITRDGDRITYWGLNLMLRRRSDHANVVKPELHDFRRAFALNFLRNGGDIYTLQKLMGHSDLQVMRRYLAQTTEDLQVAHNKFSPVDNSRL
jgi:integrase/recombinase XerD